MPFGGILSTTGSKQVVEAAKNSILDILDQPNIKKLVEAISIARQDYSLKRVTIAAGLAAARIVSVEGIATVLSGMALRRWVHDPSLAAKEQNALAAGQLMVAFQGQELQWKQDRVAMAASSAEDLPTVCKRLLQNQIDRFPASITRYFIYNPGDDWHVDFRRLLANEPLSPHSGDGEAPVISLSLHNNLQSMLASADTYRRNNEHNLIVFLFPAVNPIDNYSKREPINFQPACGLHPFYVIGETNQEGRYITMSAESGCGIGNLINHWGVDGIEFRRADGITVLPHYNTAWDSPDLGMENVDFEKTISVMSDNLFRICMNLHELKVRNWRRWAFGYTNEFEHYKKEAKRLGVDRDECDLAITLTRPSYSETGQDSNPFPTDVALKHKWNSLHHRWTSTGASYAELLEVFLQVISAHTWPQTEEYRVRLFRK